jgi:hypothetical protein
MLCDAIAESSHDLEEGKIDEEKTMGEERRKISDRGFPLHVIYPSSANAHERRNFLVQGMPPRCQGESLPLNPSVIQKTCQYLTDQLKRKIVRGFVARQSCECVLATSSSFS